MISGKQNQEELHFQVLVLQCLFMSSNHRKTNECLVESYMFQFCFRLFAYRRCKMNCNADRTVELEQILVIVFAKRT